MNSLFQNKGVLRRWTIAWATQMTRRMFEDADYRRSIAIRSFRFLRTGRIDPISALTTPRDTAALFRSLQASLPKDLGGTFERESPYEGWQSVNRATPRSTAELLGELARRQGRLPRISLITPVYNTPEPLLRALVDSVLAQIHGDWELCLVDDGSTTPHIRPLLETLASIDDRIRLDFRETNGGISLATQSGTILASGPILAFLDHDDVITPDCVAELAIAFSDNPDADIVYSDNDKIDMSGSIFSPQFKPDWSSTLLLSHMYLCHILSVRRSLYLSLGGFRSEFDGAQDFDFALRASEHARQIIHIPRILYHWRTAPGSTAVSGDAKPESIGAGLRAVQQTVDRRGILATAEQPTWAASIRIGHYALRFANTGPSVSIIVAPTRDISAAKRCRALLEKTAYEAMEITFAEELPDESLGACLNRTALALKSDFALFLSPHLEPRDRNWLSQLLGHAVTASAGAVGAKLASSDGRVVEAGLVVTPSGWVLKALSGEDVFSPGPGGYLKATRECSAVSSLCLLTPLGDFEDVGGFDEALSDALAGPDYCLRLSKKNRPTLCCTEAELYLNCPIPQPKANEASIFVRRWRGYRDPFYNPNLAATSGSFRPARNRLPSRNVTPPRLAVVTHDLAREGAPITLRDLVLGLKDVGAANPVVLSPIDGPLADDYRAAGIEVRLFRPPVLDQGQSAFVAGCEVLGGTFRDLNADTVLANTLQSYYAVHAARSAGLSAILCHHESGAWRSYFDNLPSVLRPMAFAALPLSYRVTFVADATRRDWDPLNLKENYRTIRHAIPKQQAEQTLKRWAREDARRHLGVGDEDFVLLVVGTVSQRKGQAELIEAMAFLHPSAVRRVRTFIVGSLSEPSYLDQLKTAIDALPQHLRGRILVTGAVPDIAPYFRCADAYVCTSRLESAPRVLLEAMSFSLPILTTPVYGIPEMVEEGVNARFYSPGDTRRLAQLASDLFAAPAVRSAMGKAGLDLLAMHPDFNDMVYDYAALVREAALAS